jgi:putative pyruvate formate lyase activating enzyme
VLPDNISGSEETLRFIAEEISTECHISLMSQYFPAHRAETIRPLDRRLTSDEYKRATEWMNKYKLENGWCQNEEI